MLERGDIVWALEQLSVRLGDAGHRLSISVVGGAAIVLEHNPDRGSTHDIDGWINANPATRAAVDSVVADVSLVSPREPVERHGKKLVGSALPG